MAGMFGDFSQLKYSNPELYRAKVSFWKQIIKDAASGGYLGDDCFTINPAGVQQRLRRKGLVALGLPHVLSVISAEGAAPPRTQLLDPVFRLVAMLKGLFIDDASEDVAVEECSPSRIILYDLLDEAALSLVNGHSCLCFNDAIVLYPEFRQLLRKTREKTGDCAELSVSDIKLLLSHMQLRGMIKVGSLLTGQLLKTIDSLDEIFIVFGSDYHDYFYGYAKLLACSSQLNSTIERINSKMARYTREAALSSRSGDKPQALALLQQRGVFKNSLNEKLSQLNNVNALMLKIEDAASAKTVATSYSSALQALKHAMKDVHLEDIEALNAELSLLLSSHEQVSEALGSGAILTSESDLEAELAGLVAEEPPSGEPPKKAEGAVEHAEEVGAVDAGKQESKHRIEPLLV